jgi:hypothetical protein
VGSVFSAVVESSSQVPPIHTALIHAEENNNKRMLAVALQSCLQVLPEESYYYTNMFGGTNAGGGGRMNICTNGTCSPGVGSNYGRTGGSHTAPVAV